MTKTRPKVIAVIPAHNEEPLIGDIVSRATKHVDQVIVVDDGSSDGTSKIASASGAKVIKHPSRKGAGAATRTGFEAALKDGADIVVTLDGDGQHNPDEIPRVVAPLLQDKADLAIGSRFLPPDSSPYNVIARQSRSNLSGGRVASKAIPGYRKFGIDVITFLYNFGSETKVSDAQSCFRAHSRRLLEAINITQNGFGFSVEVLIQARNKGFAITEVPISCIYHSRSLGLNPVVHGLGVAWDVSRLRLTPVERLKQVLKTPLYANAFYLIASTAVTALFNFVFWVVTARFYDTADVGFASAVISAATILVVLSYLGFDYSLIRFLPRAEKPQRLTNTAFTIGSLTGLFSAAAFVSGISLWSPALNYIRENMACFLIFILLVVLWTAFGLAGSVFVAHRRSKFTFAQSTLFALCRIPLAILLAFFFRSFGIVTAHTSAMAFALVIAVFLFLPRVQSGYKPVPTLDVSFIRDTWRYSAANYAASLLYNAPYWVLPLLVVNVLGAEANAYFYIPFMVASLLLAVPWTVSLSLFAEGSHFEDKHGENITRSFKFIFLILIPGVIVFLFVGRWLLLLFGEDYAAKSLELLRLLAVSSLPLAINAIYATILRVTGRLRELVTVWGFIAVAILLASYLIMPTAGIIGIGYAWLGTHTLIALYALLTIRGKKET